MDQFVHLNQLLAHALSFFVFFFLVRLAFTAIIYPPMKERRDLIKAEFERIEQEKAAVGSLKAQYEAHLKKVEAESRERIQQAVSEGQRVAAEIQAQAQKTAHDRIVHAEDEIARELEKSKELLKEQMIRLSLRGAEKILREKLDSAHQHKMVSEFIDEVGAGA